MLFSALLDQYDWQARCLIEYYRTSWCSCDRESETESAFEREKCAGGSCVYSSESEDEDEEISPEIDLIFLLIFSILSAITLNSVSACVRENRLVSSRSWKTHCESSVISGNRFLPDWCPSCQASSHRRHRSTRECPHGTCYETDWPSGTSCRTEKVCILNSGV